MPPKKIETIDLSGILNIRQAEDLHEQLSKLISGKSNIALDFSKVEEIDFAIVQLLYSFKKTLAEQKRKLLLKKVSEKVESQIILCDFKSLLQEN